MNLSLVIKAYRPGGKDQDPVILALEKLESDPADLAICEETLPLIASELNKGEQQREVFSRHEGINTLVVALNNCKAKNLSLAEITLRAMGNAMKQCRFSRNQLREVGIEAAVSVWNILPLNLSLNSLTLHGMVMYVAKHAMVKDENNRQDFLNHSLLEMIQAALTICASGNSPPESDMDVEAWDAAKSRLFVYSCDVIRLLSLNDDERAPLGKAHERMKEMGDSHILQILMQCVAETAGRCDAASQPQSQSAEAALGALARIICAEEIAIRALDGGLMRSIETLLRNSDNLHGASYLRLALATLRSLCASDTCRNAASTTGMVGSLIAALAQGIDQEDWKRVDAASAACAAISQRNPTVATYLVEGGILLHLKPALQGMLEHTAEGSQGRHASATLCRNLVVRSPEHVEAVLQSGVEGPLRVMMADPYDDGHAKGALRDLGCQIELKEEWTGSKGGLAYA